MLTGLEATTYCSFRQISFDLSRLSEHACRATTIKFPVTEIHIDLCTMKHHRDAKKPLNPTEKSGNYREEMGSGILH